SWSLQFGPSSGAAVISNVVSSGGTLQVGKSDNGNDSCNANVGASVCDILVPSGLAIPTSPALHWEVTGTYTGQFGTDCSSHGGTCLVLLADSSFASDGHTAFAISQDINGTSTTPTVPEPSAILLFSTGLAGVAAVKRRLSM